MHFLRSSTSVDFGRSWSERSASDWSWKRKSSRSILAGLFEAIWVAVYALISSSSSSELASSSFCALSCNSFKYYRLIQYFQNIIKLSLFWKGTPPLSLSPQFPRSSWNNSLNTEEPVWKWWYPCCRPLSEPFPRILWRQLDRPTEYTPLVPYFGKEKRAWTYLPISSFLLEWSPLRLSSKVDCFFQFLSPFSTILVYLKKETTLDLMVEL